jgi:iron complex outermembrane receptor protein
MTFKTTKLRDAITFALAAGATTLAGTGVAFAQETEGQEATTLDRIEVTGSRIKRTDVETSQPIFTLDREEIQAQGLTSIGDVIQNITAQGSALNSTFNNGGNGETQVSLRNLGAQRTLVLVNGKRWVGGTGLGGAIDLNTIPTAAVERIEVLKDGASTIYGSDAIAGVVNVILRQNYDGAEANAYLGTFDKGDGFRQSYDFTVGSAGDRWSAMFGVSYVKEEPVMAGDREISAVPVFGSTPGFGGSSTRPDGNFCILDLETFACAQPNGEYGFFIPTGTGTFRPNEGTVDLYNFAPDNYLLTPQERRSIFASGTLDITDNLRFKALAQYNERVSEQLLAANPIVLGFPVGDSTVISADNIYNPYGQDINWIQYRPNESGGRSFNQDVDTTVFDLALEGTFDIAEKPFDWEVGYTYGRNQANNITNGLFQISKLQQGLGPSFRDAQGNPVCGTPDAPIAGCVPLNILSGLNSLTPEMLDYISFTAKDAFEYELQNYYANIGGDLFDLPGGPLAFSFGIEHRRESGFDEPDALIDGGDTTGNARTATRGGFDVNEAYLELAIPVLSDMPFAKLLDFSVATRYSDYSNFGNTTNSKFGFRWRPIDDLMFRGNWSEGFRAPSIAELFTGQGDSFPSVSDPCAENLQGTPNANIPAGCLVNGDTIGPVNQANSQIRITVGGNPDLGPETSVSRTLGFVYSPSWAEGLEFTLDWWEIEIEAAVVTQSAQAILNGCYSAGIQANCALIARDGSGAISDLLAVPNNIGVFKTEGYDFTVFYRMPETSFGRFSFVWDTAYLSNAYQDLDGDGDFSEDPVSGEGGNQIGEYFGTGANNWRIRSNLQTRWEMGDWGATWMVRYYSPQDESCANLSSVQIPLLCSDPDRFTNLDGDATDFRPENRIDERFYNDVSVYWKAPWNAKITVGINNLFDEDPPPAPTAFANTFDPAYDVPGQFYYMSYNQRF